ncbi:MAG: hypothetical protein QOH21_44, partial [Acidobacteriota bacterium]|nr:hypothetical protein [Acidobacteriota bacterium]
MRQTVDERDGQHQLTAEIDRRSRQQAALGELGQAALSGVDVSLLVGQTCALVEWALEVSYVTVVECDGVGLHLRFGLGSNQTFSSCNDTEDEHRPLMLYTLALNQPVVYDNLAADPRVRGEHLLHVHGVESGACLPIPGRERAWGCITVYAETRRGFADDEIGFLRSVADLTGAVIVNAWNEEARRQAEQDRTRTEDRFRALVENASEGIALVDRRGEFLYASPSTQRVLGYEDRSL